MESSLETLGSHPEGLAQYEGMFHGRKAKLSYALLENEGQTPSVLHVHYSDSGENNSEDVVINNEQIICMTGKAENEFDIKMVSLETADSPEQQKRKLVIVHATNLPPDFVKDNIISAQFPYIADASSNVVEEQTSSLYVVISTHSGARQAEDFYSTIISPLLASGSPLERNHTKVLTTSSSTITEFTLETLLKQSNAGIHQTVLLLSGDGGIVDILNALHSGPARAPLYVPPTIGLIAMGTGNALAYSTGLSRDHTLGLRHFYRGAPHPLPTFTATFSPGSVFLIDEGRATAPLPTITTSNNPSNSETGNEKIGILHGAVVLSWALHASLVADSDTALYRTRHGAARFQMAAQELLRPAEGRPPHEYSGRVSSSSSSSSSHDLHSKERSHGERHAYVLATLLSHLEPGFCISPASKPLDNQLRLLRLGAPVSAEGVEGWLGGAFQGGKHVAVDSFVDGGEGGKDVGVVYESVDALRIEIYERDERWRRVCVDGKIVLVSLSESSSSSSEPDGGGVKEGGKWGWVEVKRNNIDESVLSIVA